MPEVIGLGQLRSDACTYLERVAAGETIDVVRRGRLVARIVSVGDWRVAPIPARSVNPIPADAGRRIELDELRKRAGRYFNRVAAGQTIEVTRSGKLVARIVSAAGNDARRNLVADATFRSMKIGLPQPHESY
jgi:prevent-host-death family protein